MSTGIVHSRGTITDADDAQLGITVDDELDSPLELGESMSVKGVDLTVSEHRGASCCADLMPETLRRTAPGRRARYTWMTDRLFIGEGEPAGPHRIEYRIHRVD